MAATINTHNSLDARSISTALQVLREYETIAYWRRAENVPSQVTACFKPTSDRALGYGVFLTNSRGKTMMARTILKTTLVTAQQQTHFQRTQQATVELKLLAKAVAVVRDDMLADCRLLSGELKVEEGLDQLQQQHFARLDVSGMRLFGMPQSYFEHRVNLCLSAFLLSVANSAGCNDEKIKAMWNHVVKEAEEFYDTLEDVKPPASQITKRKLFDIEGAPDLFDSMLYSLHTLTLEHLPGSDVIKRCCAHLPMQTMSDGGSREGNVPLPEAIRDAFARIKFPFLALNALTVTMKWTGEYVNDRGAVGPDGTYRCLDPRRIFLINSNSCYDMDALLRANAAATDSNGLTVALICATDVLSSSGEHSGERREVEKLAFCIAQDEELACKYKSGRGKVAGVMIEWRHYEVTFGESDKDRVTLDPLVDKIRTTWSIFLLAIAHRRTEIAQNLAPEVRMPELPSTPVMHYQNMNLFPPLRKSTATNLDLDASTPLGGHLLDCGPGSNYYLDGKRKRKRRYVVRDGNELKLVKKYAHRVIYYMSRVALDAGRYKLQVDLRHVTINQHTTTRELLEIMLQVGQDHASAKYALKFIEDTMMKFDNRSACFLSLNNGQEGPRLSAVLGADLLSNVDCLVRPSTGEVFLLVGVRFLKLERVAPEVLHAKEVPRQTGLKRCHIRFDSVIGVNI